MHILELFGVGGAVPPEYYKFGLNSFGFHLPVEDLS